MYCIYICARQWPLNLQKEFIWSSIEILQLKIHAILIEQLTAQNFRTISEIRFNPTTIECFDLCN